MEVAAFIIGTSGLISVARSCLDIARAIDGVRAFKEEAASLYATYNLEQVRLALWITHVVGTTQSPIDIETLHLGESQLPPMLTSASPINLHEPLLSALNEVSLILQRLNHLLEKYGATTGPNAAKEVSAKKRILFQTRLYKEGGKDEIRALLAQLKDWNDSLDRVVESRMRHHLISNLHVRLLSAAQTDQQLHVIQQAAQGTHPSLSNEAGFMRDLLGIEHRRNGQPSGLRASSNDMTPRLPPTIKDGSLRTMGRFESQSTRPVRILQEWKLGQPNWGDLEQTTAMVRADRLASMLRLEHKPPKLRCLDLVAYSIADGPQNRLDFCFLYRPPPFTDGITAPLTLHGALDLSERRRPTLAQRFGMAATLAESLLAFHTANWLHKAVCSTNVLFFQHAQTEAPDFSQPFVAGFEFARPDTVRDLTLEGPGTANGFDAYCHPELVVSLAGGARGRPRYQRRFDIYGLGVVLLEIGSWMSAADILESCRGREGSRHEHLLESAAMLLPPRVGTRYKQAVSACLGWEADGDGDELGDVTDDLRERRQRQIEQFANTVVAVLRDCHCKM